MMSTDENKMTEEEFTAKLTKEVGYNPFTSSKADVLKAIKNRNDKAKRRAKNKAARKARRK